MKLSDKQLSDIATLLRRDSIVSTTAAGSGHPSSCLSAADIVATLFFDEMRFDVRNPRNLDNDEFVLSKGHAAPLLYAALKRAGCITDNLKSLRMLSSRLEGHPVPCSLPWVKVATGSLGQGLGVGSGMALAAKLTNRSCKTFVLLGDSEIAEGSVFEALELASYHQLDNLVAFVDVNRLGQRGETLLGHKVTSYKRKFSGFGWQVLTIDGHSIPQIRGALRKARASKVPTIIFAKTFKGQGVNFIRNRDGWHGKPLSDDESRQALQELGEPVMPKVVIAKPKAKSFKVVNKNFALPVFVEATATRKAYGVALATLARNDNRVVAVDAEVSNSTYANEVKKYTPHQFIESFIAEQQMVSMASGLSTKGFIPFASTFAAFFTRAADQIRMASLSHLHMTFVGSHAGVSIGADGSSQMGLEDLALFRGLSQSTVFYPSDAVSMAKLTLLCKDIPGITYLRTTRGKTPLLYKDSESFLVGDFKVLRKSSQDKGVLIGAGITTHEALKAYELLKRKGIAVAVVDVYCVKPFKHKKLESFIKRHGGRAILAEDHHYEGGIGEMLFSKIVCKHKHLAVSGLPHSGTSEELLRRHKIDAKAYVSALQRL